MKKKIIICILLIILMTGCSANYKIKISDGFVEEAFNVTENNMSIVNIKDESGRSFIDYSKLYGNDYNLYTSFYNLYADEGCANNCDIYGKTYINNESNVGFELYHKFKIDEYKDSSLANELLPGFTAYYDEKDLIINGGNNWNFLDSYEYLDEITIEIETDYKVKETNGTKKDNSYIWKIKKNNTNSNIYIALDTTNKNDNKKETKSFIVLLLLIIAILTIISYLYFMKNKNQKDI